MNKKILSACLAALLCLPAALASDDAVRVKALKIDRSAERLFVSMTIDAQDLGRQTNRESWLIPVLTSTDGAEAIELPAVMVGGRNRYYKALRRNETTPLYRGGMIDYSAALDYQPWMEASELTLERRETGCCGSDTLFTSKPLANLDYRPREFTPKFEYLTPTAEVVKSRQLSGSAFIDFKVNNTVIYPDYRRNSAELAKIRASIDSVRQDPDMTVNRIAIVGYSSPEGSYAGNARLSEGRTASLKKYVADLYDFAPSVYSTSSVAEDWAGLRKYVENSDIENRDAILAIIDSDLQPDPKNTKIQRTYPEQYKFLLQNVYPGLRHTDYTIDYTIRFYSDPKEILEIAKTKPQNLSLKEFILAAKALEPGSKDFNYVYETAAKMYPDSEVANLNAANAAMQSGDFEAAESYLAKAGDGGEAIYARGVLAALQKNYKGAETLFSQAARLKVANAPAALEAIKELLSAPEGKVEILTD